MSAQDGWYIAEPTGETTGPMTRAELNAQFQSGRHSAAALCWHVDVAEWHPLAKVAGAGRGAAQASEPARRSDPARAPDAAPAVPPRGEPRAEAQGLPATWSGSAQAPAEPAGAKRMRQEERAERKRLKREAMERLAQRLPDGKRILSQAAPAPAAASAAATVGAAKTGASEAANTGTVFVPIALRRFAARALDTAWLGLPAAALLWGAVNHFLANADPSVGYREPIFLALVAMSMFAFVPIDALATGLFGRTPGKLLLGLAVQRKGGGGPGLVLGARRAREVLVRGLGIGIPVLTPITVIASGARLINQGATSWDDRLGLAVRAEPMDARRTQVVLGVLVLSWFLLGTDQFAALLNRLALLSWSWLGQG